MITYWDYLKIYDLLSLQDGGEPDGQPASPDELHFILVHQVFELWFKLILSEVRRARDGLLAPSTAAAALPAVMASLVRVNRTLAVAVQHWDVMETMSPQDFLIFRDKLFPGERLSVVSIPGNRDRARPGGHAQDDHRGDRSLSHIERAAGQSTSGARAWAIVCRARSEGTFRDALYGWLADRSSLVEGFGDDADATVERFGHAYLQATHAYFQRQVEQVLRAPDASRAAVEARFAETYRLAERFVMAEDVSEPQRPRFRRLRASLLYLATYADQPALTAERQLVDAVLELESLLVLWRTRHARMAEKMIGRRLGTGGASVDYLDRSLTLRVFPDLWEARTQVVPRDLAPGHPWTSPVPRR